MNKSELVAKVAEATGQPAKAVESVVSASFDAIMTAVANGETAMFLGFGTFGTTERAARAGRNPKTGEALQIAASTLPKFSASSAFKAKVKKS